MRLTSHILRETEGGEGRDEKSDALTGGFFPYFLHAKQRERDGAIQIQVDKLLVLLIHRRSRCSRMQLKKQQQVSRQLEAGAPASSKQPAFSGGGCGLEGEYWKVAVRRTTSAPPG